jgi:hypothetical protein
MEWREFEDDRSRTYLIDCGMHFMVMEFVIVTVLQCENDILSQLLLEQCDNEQPLETPTKIALIV